ncbi:MAG: hypothetical protein IJ453_05165 [Oscillospiraceae bacterium]|nr:hypothetical protein [Oscillospiraceae bacterium]
MSRFKFSSRVISFLLLVAVIFGIFAVRLYRLQVTEAVDHSQKEQDSITYLTRITAARGEILDRDGTVLVGNRAAFNIILIKDVVYSADDTNGKLRSLVNLCDQLGLEFNDHLPITKQKPYEYDFDSYNSTYNGYFKDFLYKRDWDGDISAAQFISRMRDRYNIPADWSEEEARALISVRYELDLRGFTQLPSYELLNDVEAASLASITELGIPGLAVVATTVREYYTKYAAHILGYIGDMDREQYEYYKQFDYEMDAKVGQSGLEAAFESELHATDGLKSTTIAMDGTVLSEKWITEPKAGNNVELTIDLDLQALGEDALEATILDLRENGLNGKDLAKDAEGGALVAMDVKTGEILVCASYPTYDLSRFFEDYNITKEQPYNPFFNRALMAEYPPGSVFKMVTTIAAVDSGTINPLFEVYDEGVYKRFETEVYTPRCMLYTATNGAATHQSINVMEALAVSCNYYFYEVGWMTGIDKIDEVARALGLAEPTGVELYEETGRRANPETKANLYDNDASVWYGGDTIAAAIGQSEHRFTPLQLCSYTCALANQGVRYEATFLRRVLSADYDQLIVENEPTIASQLEISDLAYETIIEGMNMSTYIYNGTSNAVFSDYDIKVCAKTGTAEHGSGGSDNGSFVLFAPADDPVIAIAIYVEKGAQGGHLGNIAKVLLDAYFSDANSIDTLPGENELN